MSDTVQTAIAHIRAGDRETGAQLLVEALRAEPRNELAWLWLSSVVPTDAQRRDCLERVLAINPHNAAAHQGLAQLAPSDQPAPPGTQQAESLPPRPPALAASPAPTPGAAHGLAPLPLLAPSDGPSAAPAEAASSPTVAASPTVLAVALLRGPLLAVIGTIGMTAISYGAALEAAAGNRPEVTGRNRLFKEIYAWLIITLGPQGVLVVGGLLSLAALAWLLLRGRAVAAVLETVRAAAPPAARPAPSAPPLPPAVVRGTLVALIALVGAGFGWAYLSSPKQVPGLIAEGTVLDLRDQGLTAVSLAGIPTDQLTLVDLSGNPITELPTDIGALSRVEHLYINNTGLTHLPPEIGAMTNLRTLVLGDNQLVELPPEIGRLEKLEVLDVHGNRLRALPPELAQLPNLRQLNLQFNPIGKGAVPEPLRSRPALEILVMYAER